MTCGPLVQPRELPGGLEREQGVSVLENSGLYWDLRGSGRRGGQGVQGHPGGGVGLGRDTGDPGIRSTSSASLSRC